MSGALSGEIIKILSEHFRVPERTIRHVTDRLPIRKFGRGQHAYRWTATDTALAVIALASGLPPNTIDIDVARIAALPILARGDWLDAPQGLAFLAAKNVGDAVTGLIEDHATGRITGHPARVLTVTVAGDGTHVRIAWAVAGGFFGIGSRIYGADAATAGVDRATSIVGHALWSELATALSPQRETVGAATPTVS
jgi:hypothetical protein